MTRTWHSNQFEEQNNEAAHNIIMSIDRTEPKLKNGSLPRLDEQSLPCTAQAMRLRKGEDKDVMRQLETCLNNKQISGYAKVPGDNDVGIWVTSGRGQTQPQPDIPGQKPTDQPREPTGALTEREIAESCVAAEEASKANRDGDEQREYRRSPEGQLCSNIADRTTEEFDKVAGALLREYFPKTKFSQDLEDVLLGMVRPEFYNDLKANDPAGKYGAVDITSEQFEKYLQRGLQEELVAIEEINSARAALGKETIEVKNPDNAVHVARTKNRLVQMLRREYYQGTD